MIIQLPVAARGLLILAAASCMFKVATAQNQITLPAWRNATSTAGAGGEAVTRSAVEWLQRMHVASRQRNYVGTFVVSAAAGNLTSARIWHVCEGDVQVERIEALSGPARSTFRRNDQVMTFLHEPKVVKSEKRDNLELFPSLVGTPDSSIDDFYTARVLGKDRVAGFDTDIVELEPRDGLRFGYRVWSERRSGLAVKLQTIDAESRVVEQSAFSDLQFDAPVKASALTQMMSSTAGYRVEKSEVERTTAVKEGWSLRAPIAGFKPVSCYRRAMGGNAQSGHTMQWTFSDGLASVSLFVEPYDAQRQPKEVLLALGATYTLTRRLMGNGREGDWWLTVVGEVPPQALDAFARSLIRVQ